MIKVLCFQVLEYGLYGVPVVSMPACGKITTHVLNTTDSFGSICLRWYQIAAYMPALNRLGNITYVFIEILSE